MYSFFQSFTEISTYIAKHSKYSTIITGRFPWQQHLPLSNQNDGYHDDGYHDVIDSGDEDNKQKAAYHWWNFCCLPYKSDQLEDTPWAEIFLTALSSFLLYPIFHILRNILKTLLVLLLKLAFWLFVAAILIATLPILLAVLIVGGIFELLLAGLLKIFNIEKKYSGSIIWGLSIVIGAIVTIPIILVLIAMCLVGCLLQFLLSPIETLRNSYNFLTETQQAIKKQQTDNNKDYNIFYYLLFVPKFVIIPLKVFLTIIFCPLQTAHAILTHTQSKALKTVLLILAGLLFLSAWAAIFIFAAPAIPAILTAIFGIFGLKAAVILAFFAHFAAIPFVHQVFNFVSLFLANHLVLPVLHLVGLHLAHSQVINTITFELPILIACLTYSAYQVVSFITKNIEFPKIKLPIFQEDNEKSQSGSQLEQLSQDGRIIGFDENKMQNNLYKTRPLHNTKNNKNEKSNDGDIYVKQHAEPVDLFEAVMSI